MNVGLKTAFLIVLLTSGAREPVAVAEEIIPVDALINGGAAYDGRQVTIAGEVIGDLMKRGEEYWVNVLSPEGAAIGVRAREDQISAFACPGDYFHTGDLVMVQGIYYRYAKKFGGETCIVAAEVKIIQPGTEVSRPLSENKILISVLLTLMSGAAAAFMKAKISPAAKT